VVARLGGHPAAGIGAALRDRAQAGRGVLGVCEQLKVRRRVVARETDASDARGVAMAMACTHAARSAPA